MFLGIDVGGTFTDAVVVGGNEVLAMAKTPTTHGQLLEGILTSLDSVLTNVDKSRLARVALSTTIVTNALVEGRVSRVGLLAMPGPGLDITGMVPEKPYLLSGCIDHRGREVAAPREEETIAASGVLGDYEAFAVSGKFSVRNPRHEILVAEWISKAAKPAHISSGASVSGSLNFLRRTNSAYYNAAVWRQFQGFAAAIEQALAQRGITAPVYILKADGGTMPLTVARQSPVEAIFTGPAASVLGIMALKQLEGEVVTLDIGGTTTDITLWQDGLPLFAAKGAKVAGYLTAVRSFRLQSVGVGGDSYVRREDGVLKVGPMRRGPAVAVGGPELTLSDAMIAAGMIKFGDRDRAVAAVNTVTKPGQTVADAAQEVLDTAAGLIWRSVKAMIDDQAAEPVYRVDDILNSRRFQPQAIVGVGGAAPGLIPTLARKQGIACCIPEWSTVANAIGAAVSRPTMEITLRADTEQGYFTIAELGIREKLASRSFTLSNAYQLAQGYLLNKARQAGIAVQQVETIYSEEFNLVRGFRTTGRIITCRLQTKPGALLHIGGKGESI